MSFVLFTETQINFSAMLKIFAFVMLHFFRFFPTDWSIDVEGIQDLH